MVHFWIHIVWLLDSFYFCWERDRLRLLDIVLDHRIHCKKFHCKKSLFKENSINVLWLLANHGKSHLNLIDQRQYIQEERKEKEKCCNYIMSGHGFWLSWLRPHTATTTDVNKREGKMHNFVRMARESATIPEKMGIEETAPKEKFTKFIRKRASGRYFIAPNLNLP